MNAGSNTVSIIDAKGEKVIGVVALEGNPEFAAADGQGNVFVNVGSSSQIAKIDAKTLKLGATYPPAPGAEPTGLSYDAKGGRLFSGCANNTMIVMDAATGKILASLPIGAGVDATSYDPELALAFSSNGGDGTVTIVGSGDNGQPAVVATVPTHNRSRTMAIDTRTHSLFLLAPDNNPPTLSPAVAAALGIIPPAAMATPQRGRGGPAVLMRFDLNTAK